MFSLKVSAQLLSCLHCSLGMNRTAASRSLRDFRHLARTLGLNLNVLLQTNLLLLPLRRHLFLRSERLISGLLRSHRHRCLVLAIVVLLLLFLEEIWKLLRFVSRLIARLGSSMVMMVSWCFYSQKEILNWIFLFNFLDKEKCLLFLCFFHLDLIPHESKSAGDHWKQVIIYIYIVVSFMLWMIFSNQFSRGRGDNKHWIGIWEIRNKN